MFTSWLPTRALAGRESADPNRYSSPGPDRELRTLKDNFLLTGEITSGDLAPDYVDFFGRNLDAVLGIVAYPNRLAALAKGMSHPNEFFELYDHSVLGGSYRQLGRFIVHVLDDHDMSSRATKARFSAGSDVPNLFQQVAHVVNPDHPTYLRIAAIARLRNRQGAIGKTLRRGHLFPRETSFVGYPFAIHGPGELIAWSQLFFETEVLMALNPHGYEDRGAEVTVDESLHPDGSTMTILYRGDWDDAELRAPPQDQVVTVQHRDGRATVRIDLPPSGMAILA